MVLETYIDAQELTSNQSLVFVDENGKKWDVEEALNTSPSSDGSSEGSRPEVILERWIIQLSGGPPREVPSNIGSILPRTYKNSIILFRSLFMSTRLFPAWRMVKKLFQSRASAATPKVRYRISQNPKIDERNRMDSLTIPLYSGHDDVIETHAFDPVDSPAGPFSIHVTYRTSCDFRLDDSEAFLSSRFMGMDAPFSERPSVRRMESAPTRRNYMDEEMTSRKEQRPSLADQSHAYGSLTTFHQLSNTGTSPISALRNANFAPESPDDSKKQPTRSSQTSRSSLRSGDSGAGVGRRPSVSFMPFKAPSLSNSPSQAEQTGTSYPKGSSLGKSSPLAVLAEARHPSGPPPRGSPKTADHSRNSSINSPKPPAPQRYSSSFSHRKAKLSTGGSKTEDDASSGKASTSSAQKESGNFAEGGTSSGSLQTDDDNIADFVKKLDQVKDLRSFKTSPQGTPSDAATRRTSAQLYRYQQMKASNTALTESITSSQMLHRSSSSSSRQLASVPPMIAATSISTSSSPGKPISPHTPHTPAIPSRLSANSVADYTRSDRRARAVTEEQAPIASPPGAIDIPTSPRLFDPSYRRSSSAAQGHRTHPFEDDEILPFPFDTRSASLDVDDRPPPSRSALIGMQGEDNHPPTSAIDNPSVDSRPAFAPYPASNRPGSQGGASMERQRSSEEQGSSYSRRGFPYRPHLGRGRGDTPPQGSSSSLVERGSHTSSEGPGRRGSGRYSFSRPTSTFEDEDNLLFAMSDFDTVQQSRRSREDLRGVEPTRGPRRGGS